MPKTLPLAVLVLVALLAVPAFAQETEQAMATELFNAGRDLMAEGRYADACPKLAESGKLESAVGTSAKLAECKEHLGELVQARVHWQQALNMARAQSDERAGLVEAELTRIDGLVPKLRIVPPSSPPADMVVQVDGVQLGPNSVGLPIPMDPGVHRISVSATGKKTWDKGVSLKADGQLTLLPVPEMEDLVAPKPVVAPPPRRRPVRPAALPRDEGSSMHPLRSVGLVVAGVGVVGLGVGAYFGGVAKAKVDDSNALGCDGNLCTPDAADKRNEARDAGNVSTVAFIAGGALLAGGLGLWLFGPSDEGAQTGSLRATAAVTPNGTNLSMQGSF